MTEFITPLAETHIEGARGRRSVRYPHPVRIGMLILTRHQRYAPIIITTFNRKPTSW